MSLPIVWSCWNSSRVVIPTHCVFAHCVKLLTQFLGCCTYPSCLCPSCLCPLCEAVETALWMLQYTYHRVFAHCVKLLKQLSCCYANPLCLCPLCEAVDTVLGMLRLPIVSLPIVSLPTVWSCWNKSCVVIPTGRVFAHCGKLSPQLLECYTYPSCLCPLCEAAKTALRMLHIPVVSPTEEGKVGTAHCV